MKSQAQFTTSFLKALFSKGATPIVFVILGMLVKAAPAEALTFNFSYAKGTNQNVIDGFEKAGSLWSSQLSSTYIDTDCFCNRDTNVNLFVNFGQLSSDNALGGARPGMVRVDYDKYLTSTFRNISSEDDWTAFKNFQLNDNGKATQSILEELGVNKYNTDSQNRSLLSNLGLTVNPNIAIDNQSNQLFSQLGLRHIQQIDRNNVSFDSDRFDMLVSESNVVTFDKRDELGSPKEKTVLDNNGNDNNKKIWLTRANARALDILKSDDDAFDGEIAINSRVLGEDADAIWDFGRVYSDNAKVDSNKYDFLSVATHEIGHTLGFVSGLDAFELLLSTAAEAGGTGVKDGDLDYVAPMDLFRYSADSSALETFDWSTTSGERYFSINGGDTKLADFATGVGIDGDGYQSSHWAQQDNVLGVMNPTLRRGEALFITDLDLQFLDVLGWDRAGSEVFADMSGINVGMMAIEDGLSAKIEGVGLDWEKLESLLTKPTEQLLTELSKERAALLVDRLATLEPQLAEAKAALEVEEKRFQAIAENLKDNLNATEKAIENQEDNLQDLQSGVADLQKEQTALQKNRQDVLKEIQGNQAKLNNTTKEKDRAKIQKTINELQKDLSGFDADLRSNQSDQNTAQSSLQVGQSLLEALQKEFQQLQSGATTSPLLKTLSARYEELDATVKTLNSLEKDSIDLAKKADSYTIKTKLSALEEKLKIKLSNLNEQGDGQRRAIEEQKILNEVLKLAQEQEVRWNQLVSDHEEVLFPGAESQVQKWLEGSPAALTSHMETATTTQLAALYATLDNAEGTQKDLWFSNLTQASMRLANIDEETAAKELGKALKELSKVLEESGPDELLSRGRTSTSNAAWRYWLSRGRSSQANNAFRYWQTINPSYITREEYSDEGDFVEGVESATLNQMLYSTASPENREEVPEPSSILGLIMAGGLGAKLRRRRNR